MKAFTGQACVQHTNFVKVCGCIGPGHFNNIAYICGWANIFRACGTLVKQAASVVDLIRLIMTLIETAMMFTSSRICLVCLVYY